LLAAEHELLTRATGHRNASAALIPEHIVDQVLADHPQLDTDQAAMVRSLATDGAGVSVVVGKAGTGKSTAIGAYRAALDRAGHPVIGVAPSATAAHQLGRSGGVTDTATVDRLLVEIEHGHRRLPRGVVVVLDEAGMCPTRTRLALQQAVDAVGGKVVDVGDHRQIPSVDVGGGHYSLAQRLGATVLGQNHRFRDPVYRDAAELLRDRQPESALELLRSRGAVSDEHEQPVDAWAAMVDDWLAYRENGDQVLMLASERTTVAQLNQLARAHLVHRGQVHRRSRTYRSADDSRTVALGVGDEVILRRNDTRLAQPGGKTVAVRNGMTGRITRTDRRSITVQLDANHIGRDGPTEITLAASYIGANVDYAYARTVDTAQGATVDHSLFAPTAATSAERAYVALSRGRVSNRIYATTDRTWADALAEPRGHTLASDQQPDVPDTTRRPLKLDELPDNLTARRTVLQAAAACHGAAYAFDQRHVPRRRPQSLVDPQVQQYAKHRNQHRTVQDHRKRERDVGIGL
jgi:ATP-dependent exoDNAse (exonuclease V) alpha subunit